MRNHISSILAKMGLSNRTQIVIAYLRGVITQRPTLRHSKMAAIDLMPFQNLCRFTGLMSGPSIHTFIFETAGYLPAFCFYGDFSVWSKVVCHSAP